MGKQFWDTADLVMEVVSDDNRDHDLKTKRCEYALAGIPEYWIVDPRNSTITILVHSRRAEKKSYIIHGRFAPGAMATSKTLPGFEVDVTATFSQ
jgi:Uma2 family endonuclease